MTVSTLTRVLDDLRNQGLIAEVGLGESTGGRRPIIYEANPRYAYLFGLDISRIQSRLVLFDLHLRPLDSCSWPMDAGMTPARLLELVADQALGMMHRHSLSAGQLLGMGIGAVGPLDRKQGIMVNPLHFAAEGWIRVPIQDYFERKLGIPVCLDNGANTALLGEYWTADNRQNRHLLYVHAGIGIRTAVMNEGRILYGVMDTEGAAGQMIIESGGVPSRVPNGNYGAWESYVSIQTLERQAREKWKQGRTTLLDKLAKSPDQVIYPQLVQAQQEGDPMVEELFRQAAAYFGIGLANLINVLHPEEVILGGPLITSSDLFYAEATRVALEKTYYYPAYNVRFHKGLLGDDAVATGAAAMVVDQLTER